MAKLRLDGTSRAPSPYSEFTKNYRMSENVEDQRGSPESREAKRIMYGSATEFKIRERDATQTPYDPRSKRGTNSAWQGGDTRSQTTPGSGQYNDSSTNDDQGPAGIASFPEVRYAPQMQEYVDNSKKK